MTAHRKQHVGHKTDDTEDTTDLGLHDGGLGARLEGVGQAALAAVLAVMVECHLKTPTLQ